MVKSLRFLATAVVAFVSVANVYAQNLSDRFNETYPGDLQVTVDGAVNPTNRQTVIINKVDATHIDFMLKNFILDDGEGNIMPVGTIIVNNLELTDKGTNAAFSFNDKITIEDGEEGLAPMWLGPMLGEIAVKLEGEGGPATITITIDIEFGEQIIHVDFLGDIVDGIANVSVTPKKAGIYTIGGVKTDALQKGINIMIDAEGNTKKIMK